MGKIRKILKDLILHLSIWVKEPVYKPETIVIEKLQKKNKEGFVIVDGVKIEDDAYCCYNHGTTPSYNHGTTPMWTSACMSSGYLVTSACYPNYFKNYLTVT